MIKKHWRFIVFFIIGNIALIYPLFWGGVFTIIAVGGLFSKPPINDQIIGFIIGNLILFLYFCIFYFGTKFLASDTFPILKKWKNKILLFGFTLLNILLIILAISADPRPPSF